MNQLHKLITVVALLTIGITTHAQYLRSSYFMENSHYGMKLNPALRPDRGYVSLPGVNLGVKVGTNGFGINDAIDCFDSDVDFFDNDKLYGRLEDMNKINLSAAMDLISFGFYKGKAFWSFNVGTKVLLDASVPKSMFDFVRDVDGLDDWNNVSLPTVSGEKIKGLSYVEVGLGYSRPINDKLTVGGKLKALIGAANFNLAVNKLQVEANMPEYFDPNDDWSKYHASIQVDATLEGNMKGLETTHSTDRESGRDYIDGFEMNSFGVAGYGAAIDLGATYQLTDRLMLSAAITDLGFISWSKGSAIGAKASANETYGKDNYYEFFNRVENNEIFDFDLIQLSDEKEMQKSRSTAIPMTFALGAEYDLAKDRLSVGGLFTNQRGPLHSLSELTLSANFHPNRFLGLTGSYSMIQSGGKSFGAAIKFGPVFVGTDYMYFGKNSRSANAFVGFAFGMGQKRP